MSRRSQAALVRGMKKKVDSAPEEVGLDQEKKKELPVVNPQMATMYLKIKHHSQRGGSQEREWYSSNW